MVFRFCAWSRIPGGVLEYYNSGFDDEEDSWLQVADLEFLASDPGFGISAQDSCLWAAGSGFLIVAACVWIPAWTLALGFESRM